MGHEDQPQWRQAAAHTLHTSLLLKAILEEQLQEQTGLLLADNEALLNLAAKPLRMSDIAHRLILSRGGTTKVIDRLETLGYVRRLPDPEDRRATVVEITESGRKAMAGARAVIDEGLEATWAQHVTDEEAGVIIDVMKRVLGDHLDEHQDDHR
jgi:DNA-binding MarR family transcriptional regulator